MYHIEEMLHVNLLSGKELDVLWKKGKEGDVDAQNSLKFYLVCMGIRQVQILSEQVGIDSAKIFEKFEWGYFEKIGENKIPPSFYIRESYEYVKCCIESLIQRVENIVILTEEYEYIVSTRRTMIKESLEEVPVEELSKRTGISDAVVTAVQKQIIQLEKNRMEQKQMQKEKFRKWEDLISIFGEDILYRLSELELHIMNYMLFGDNGRLKTLSETAEFFNISEKSVRCMENELFRNIPVRKRISRKISLD